MDESIQLGGNIELSGFSEMERGVMVVLKKIVGNYARRMTDQTNNFEKLSLTMKKIGVKEKGEIYELHAKMIDNGKPITSSTEGRNLFVAVDETLKKIMNQIKK